MRIAMVGCTVNPRAGGMGRALYDHAAALADAGQEAVVYTLDSIALRSNIGALQNDRITVGLLRRFFSIGKAAWVARFDPPLDTYDVVHLHLPFFGVAERVANLKRSAVIPGARSATRDDRKRARLVVTYHMDAVGRGLKKWYFNWWYRHRFKKILDACDAVAVTSRAYARDSWLAKAGVDVEKCEEILLRVDTDRFRMQGAAYRMQDLESAPSTPLPTPYFLFVGAIDRAHYFKGLSLLLRAFKSLDPGSAAAPRSGMTLVVVGAGELLEHYKKEAATLGIGDRVQFTGGVTDEELARWYAGALALVLPSTDRSEAFGIVLIEAMACGTPVIASDLSGVREVVERVKGGVLVPFGIAEPVMSESEGSPRSGLRNDNLIDALQQMWQQPWSGDDRAALAARAAATYSRATLAVQLLKWYNQTHVPSR